MRAALIVLAGCGRIAFDPLAGDGGGTGDLGTDVDPTLPMLTCNRTVNPVSGVPADADLVATGLNSTRLGVAWAPHGGTPDMPIVMRIDRGSGSAVTPPTPVTLVVANRLGTLADIGGTVYLHAGSAGNQAIVTFDQALANPLLLDTDVGLVGDNAIITDAVDAPVSVEWASGSTFYGAYLTTATGIGNQNGVGLGGTITDLTCDRGSDHSHCAWRIGNSCSGWSVDYGSPTSPAFGGTVAIALDCVTPRGATVESAPSDTSIIVYATMAGPVQSVYIPGTFDPPIALTAAGRAPRTASDGTRLWFAWLEQTNELHIGHKLPGDPGVTSAVISESAPAGDEAFELVRTKDNKVYLVVLSTTELRTYELCAP